MYSGFPVSLLSLIRCPIDGSTLDPESRLEGMGHVEYGHLTCGSCARRYDVREGILALLDRGLLDDESQTECSIRDTHAINDGLELG